MRHEHFRLRSVPKTAMNNSLFVYYHFFIYIVIIDEQVVVYQQQEKKVLTSYLEEITWSLPINALGTFTMWMQTYHPGYMYMYKHKK